MAHPVDGLTEARCREALRAIFDAMDGAEWSADTLDAIAYALDDAGLALRAPGEGEEEDEPPTTYGLVDGAVCVADGFATYEEAEDARDARADGFNLVIAKVTVTP